MAEIATAGALGQLGAPTGQAPARDGSKLGKDEFLKLLMAQISNQDPGNPQDGSAYVAQLATFTQVELLSNASARLDQLLLAQASSNQTLSASIIGRDVRFRSDTVALGSESTVPLQAQLKGDAANVTWTITDADGKVVRTLRSPDQKTGAVVVEWDGRDDSGKRLAGGQYSVRVAADNGEMEKVDVTSEGSGRVSGISYENGYAELLVGSRRLTMSSVLELHEAKD